jgi:ABC-type uncharacterized transport system substrate-binding protein
MQRREFITLFGGAAAAWPLLARAQQPGLPVVGVLRSDSPDLRVDIANAFRKGLGEIGYVEGRNVAIEYRWAEGQFDRFPLLAADLVRRRVAVVLAEGEAPAKAAKAATRTIPIVFATGGDPVRAGLVASLNQPGGNITGVSYFSGALGAKQLEIIRELIASPGPLALLIYPDNPTDQSMRADVQAAAGAIGQPIEVVSASSEVDLEATFAALAQRRVRVVSSRIVSRIAVARREAGRPAGHAADQVRTGHQSQDRQSARPDRSAHTAICRRRGYRVMQRRDFIALLGGATAAWPVAVRAQQDGRLRRVGWLTDQAENDPGLQATRAALQEELAKHGWIEGSNLRIERRFGAGNPRFNRAYAAELVGLEADVIVTVGGAATEAARRQTQTIPIVFVGGPDAVAGGLVQNIARPEGNITGFSSREPSIAGRCLQLLKEAAPRVTRVAIILNPDAVSGPSYLSSIEAAAPALGVEALKTPVRNAVDTVRLIDTQ